MNDFLKDKLLLDLVTIIFQCVIHSMLSEDLNISF